MKNYKKRRRFHLGDLNSAGVEGVGSLDMEQGNAIRIEGVLGLDVLEARRHASLVHNHLALNEHTKKMR